MKKIFILAAILVLSAPVFAAIDTWFNTNPHKSYNKEKHTHTKYGEKRKQ